MGYSSYFIVVCIVTAVCNNSVGQNIRVKSNPHGKTTITIRDTIQTDTGPLYFDTVLTEKLPASDLLSQNYLGKSLMTPTGWGGPTSGGALFIGAGGTFPQLYTEKNDMIGVIGFAGGDAKKYIGVTATMNINDVSKFRNFSSNIILYKHLSLADAISVGGLHLLNSKRSDSDPSYYIAYSHAVQSLKSKKTGASALYYTIGVGTGRFYEKSLKDVQGGKSKHGTAVFANVSLELASWLNANVEWSGINLHAGVSVQPISSLPYINLGLADITRFSGKEARFVASIYYSIRLWN